MSLLSMLTTDAVLKKATITAGTGGEPTISFSNVPVKTHIWQKSMEERATAQRIGVISTHGAYLEASIAVANKDELWDGTTKYEIIGINKKYLPPGDHHISLDLVLVN